MLQEDTGSLGIGFEVNVVMSLFGLNAMCSIDSTAGWILLFYIKLVTL